MRSMSTQASTARTKMATDNLDLRLLEIENMPIDEQVEALDQIAQELEKNLL
jgi:tetrahydromethanopterin S-methyltransferase subunit B